jgi:hypothetical protein
MLFPSKDITTFGTLVVSNLKYKSSGVDNVLIDVLERLEPS